MKMASLQSIVIASVLIVVLFVNQGSAIRCYECNSHNDTRCAQDKPVKELLVECSDHKNGISHTLCRKITQVIEFSVNSLPPENRVIRSCGWVNSTSKSNCYQRSGFGGRQEVCACYEDDCNGAKSITAAIGLVISALIFTRF